MLGLSFLAGNEGQSLQGHDFTENKRPELPTYTGDLFSKSRDCTGIDRENLDFDGKTRD